MEKIYFNIFKMKMVVFMKFNVPCENGCIVYICAPLDYAISFLNKKKSEDLIKKMNVGILCNVNFLLRIYIKFKKKNFLD